MADGPGYFDITDPLAAAQAQQIAQRQALAQMLLQNSVAGMNNLGQTQMAGQVAVRNSPVQGIAGLANFALGLKMQRQAATDLGNLNVQRVAEALRNNGGGQPTQPVQSEGENATPISQSVVANPAPDELTQALMANRSRQAGPAQQPQPQPQPQLTPSGPFAGMTPQDILLMRVQNPGKFQDMVNGWNKTQLEKMPDAVRLSQYAGDGPAGQVAAARGALTKANLIEPMVAGPGSTLVDPTSRMPIASIPDASGSQVSWGPNGPTKAPIPGALAANQANAAAESSGRYYGSGPVPAVDEFGRSVFVDPQKLLPNPIGTNSNLDRSPQVRANPTPGAGLPSQPSSAPGRQSPQVTNNSGNVFPAPAPGQVQFSDKVATAAADRANQTRLLAAESPMRVNVLDNIIGLSSSGVQTGPSAEFANQIKGYVASTPGLRDVASKWGDDVAGFQELQKFTYQNALRNWQAAGGGGTDSQLEAASHASPSDRLFPQALQSVARWGKASELALQAKANAQDAYLAARGNTPQAQQQFEQEWRNSFRPTDFIKQVVPATNAQGWTLRQDPKGNLAYVSPDMRQHVGVW